MENELRIRRSKFLAKVLRHQPESVGLTLEKEGWVDVSALLDACRRKHQPLTREELNELVALDEKGRYAFDAAGTRIRANQGHSTGSVELSFAEATPPKVLYHGTVDRFLDSIFEKGLIKGNRHHVHLSADTATAMKVGERRGRPVLLEVYAARLHADGAKVYVSDNGVWLIEHVPPGYLRLAA